MFWLIALLLLVFTGLALLLGYAIGAIFAGAKYEDALRSIATDNERIIRECMRSYGGTTDD